MGHSNIVSKEEWLRARVELLEKEKAHSRARDELTRARQELPWVRVEKEYLFEGPNGTESLDDLFQGKSQLIVYHFMFDTDWDEGCKSCSFLADHYGSSVAHIAQRDVALVTVSKAPLARLDAFKKRMGWTFKWVSSEHSDFNRDFHVSFTDEEIADHRANYNFRDGSTFPMREAPGISVFARDEDGNIFHTYSAYARGLETFIGAYHLLDIVPKGRDESELSYGMEWVRHRDRYDDPGFVDPYVDTIGRRE
jgi:predicted dithiol-disulfide oxidoreductase (DUF899 family)